MPHRRPVQLEPDLYIGPHRIFFTMCTFERAPAFTERATVQMVTEELLRTGEAYHVEAVAYCFMPDHLHALIEGTAEDSHLLKFMKMFRQRNGHTYRADKLRRLWQEGYVDRFLRADEATLDVVRYVVANPVRAGLCADPRQYPYLGSSRYSIDDLVGSLA